MTLIAALARAWREPRVEPPDDWLLRVSPEQMRDALPDHPWIGMPGEGVADVAVGAEFVVLTDLVAGRWRDGIGLRGPLSIYRDGDRPLARGKVPRLRDSMGRLLLVDAGTILRVHGVTLWTSQYGPAGEVLGRYVNVVWHTDMRSNFVIGMPGGGWGNYLDPWQNATFVDLARMAMIVPIDHPLRQDPRGIDATMARLAALVGAAAAEDRDPDGATNKGAPERPAVHQMVDGSPYPRPRDRPPAA